MSSLTVSTTMNNALIAFSREIIENTIIAIAKKHNLDVSETIREFMPNEFIIYENSSIISQPAKKVEEPVVKEKKEKKEKKKEKPVKTEQPKFVLPWCGEAKTCWCSALRANYGLYTQCTMPPLPGEKYCKTCAKHVAASPDGIPPCGTVEQRLAVPGLEYRDPKGKKASLYTAFMKKNNLTPEMVMEEAAKFGLTVPEEQLNTVSTGRGRPKKSALVDDSASDVSSPKRKAGRPKKVTNHEPEPEDLVAAAMSSPQSSPKSPPPKLTLQTTFDLHDSDQPNTPSFQKIALTPDDDDDDEL